MDKPDTLIHFGKKGMKWGVRKESSSGSGSSQTGMSTSQKRAIKTATLVVAGASVAVGAAYLAKKGVFTSNNANSVIGKAKSIVSNSANSKTVTSSGKKFVEATLSKKNPVMDQETRKFLSDSTRRIAEDNAYFRNQAQETLKNISSDRFTLQWIKGSNPEMYANLVRTANGLNDFQNV